MGQHYLPQHYLRSFATPDDPHYIWMYDKTSKEFKRLPIQNVAQSSEFYSEEDERALSENIEQPAQAPLEQLGKGQQVDVRGRLAVTIYLESMIKRVPHIRNNMLEKAPQTKVKLLARIRGNPELLELLVLRLNLTREEVLHLIEQWEQTFDSKPLSERDDIIRRQWSSLAVLECILSMTWRVIRADDSHHFLTGDNPVFFHKEYGLQPPDGEFSFPLSSDVALHGSWQGSRGELLFDRAKPEHVKEIDRRAIVAAVRFVFCHEKASWVCVVAEKPIPRLNRIRW